MGRIGPAGRYIEGLAGVGSRLRTVELDRLSERIGALVRGVDLAAPLSEADRTTLRQAMLRARTPFSFVSRT